MPRTVARGIPLGGSPGKPLLRLKRLETHMHHDTPRSRALAGVLRSLRPRRKDVDHFGSLLEYSMTRRDTDPAKKGHES